MTKDDKREVKKDEIKEIAGNYRDQSGNIDLTKLRQDHKKTYSRIPYYFGNINAFLEEMGAKRKSGINETSGTSVNRAVMRNQLAYDMLNILYKEKNLSFEDIGEKYGVSRMYVSKLYRELSAVFEEEQNDSTENL